MSISAPMSTENNRSGSGSYTPLKRQKKENQNTEEQYEYLDQKDIRMRFKNSKDPVFVAFEHLDRQPLKKLAIEFVMDSISDIMFFVSKFN